MMNLRTRSKFRSFVLFGWIFAFGCENQSSSADTVPVPMMDRSIQGDLQMRLQGVRELASAMDIRVYRPDGTQIATGKIPVPIKENDARSVMVLPAGLGYTVSLSGRTRSGAQCVGTGMFNVVAGQSTDLRLTLTCDASSGGSNGGNNGNVNIEVDLDAGPAGACPNVSFVSALPDQMNVGGVILLRAASTHASAQFRWQASVGRFSTPNAADTEYACTKIGPAKVTLVVSAGPRCQERQEIELDCLAIADQSDDAPGEGSTGAGGEGAGEDSEGAGTGSDNSGPGDSGDGSLSPVRIQFQPTVAGEAFKCGHTYQGLGTSDARGTVGDFRFFVHNIRLFKADGSETPFELQDREIWQGQGVALVDFEGGPDRGCYGGTKGRNTEITGMAPKGDYEGIRFSIGVPSALSHADPSTLQAPFTAGGMAWSWLAGYKFLKFELGTGVLHVGSTGCTGTPPDQVKCRRANRPEIELIDFDPLTQAIVVDLAAAFQTSDLGQNPSCHSTGEACPALFEQVGLNFQDGQPTGTQRVFSVGPG